MTDVRYAYSYDEEYFRGEFESRGAAVAEAVAFGGSGYGLWTGKIVPYVPRLDWLAGDVVDALRREAGEESEHAESWLGNVAPEDKAELQKELEAAVTRFLAKPKNKPQFFMVDEVEEHQP